MRVPEDGADTRGLFTSRAALVLGFYTFEPRRARLVAVFTRDGPTGRLSVSTPTRHTLLQLPLLAVFADHPWDPADIFQLRCSAASWTAFVFQHNLELTGTVEDGTGAPLTSDVALVTGTNRARVYGPLSSREVQVAVEETSAVGWGQEIPRTYASLAAAIWDRNLP